MEPRPSTPAELALTARVIAKFAVDAPPSGRAMCLDRLCAANPLLHDLVVAEIAKIERRRRVIGYCVLFGITAVIALAAYLSRVR